MHQKNIDLMEIISDYDVGRSHDIGIFLEEYSKDSIYNQHTRFREDSWVEQICNSTYFLEEQKLIVFRTMVYDQDGENAGHKTGYKWKHDSLAIIGPDRESVDDLIQKLMEFIESDFHRYSTFSVDVPLGQS